MFIQQLVERIQGDITARTARYNELTEQINNNRGAETPDQAREDALVAERGTVSADLATLRGKLATYQAEAREIAEVERRSNEHHPTGVRVGDGAEREVYGAAGTTAVRMPQGTLVRAHDLRPAAVQRGQRFTDHEVTRGVAAQAAARDASSVAQYGNLGQLVRALSTTSGSAVVPTIWAGDVIDRARNLSAVIQAGAQVIPMDSKTVQIGRLTSDPTAAFRAEGSAITASDPVFDNVTLTATSMNALVVASMEWFQDADNADTLVMNAIAQAMATQLDLVALYGSITAGAGTVNLPTPSNPRGILGTLNALAATNVLGAATNGTAQTSTAFFNELLDTLYTPKDYNEQPNGMIYNAKLARLYAKAYDTTGQPLAWPADLATLPRFVSNQIPTYTQGTMTSASDVFAGDFTQLLIGQRLDVTIQVLTERYADTGQIGILASWRGDVGIARPRAFSVYKALKAA